MEPISSNHYAVLGLDRDCSAEQIRSAYRVLAKQFHPDVNGGSREASAKTQQLNAAYEVLSDPEQRRNYDALLNAPRSHGESSRRKGATQNISQDVPLRIEEFFRGITLDVRVNDPGMTDGPETYGLSVPPGTAPGTRFRVPRAGGGFVIVRTRLRPDFRFKSRGSDLRVDLRISSQRAALGGAEMVQGVMGKLRVTIPRGVARGEVIRISGEGLPKPRGGRGDLLVRVQYRPEVRITRAR